MAYNYHLDALLSESYPTMFCINTHIAKLSHTITDIEFLDTRDINSSDIITKFNKIAKRFNLILLNESQKILCNQILLKVLH